LELQALLTGENNLRKIKQRKCPLVPCGGRKTGTSLQHKDGSDKEVNREHLPQRNQCREIS
jgi:hypothetical protein